VRHKLKSLARSTEYATRVDSVWDHPNQCLLVEAVLWKQRLEIWPAHVEVTGAFQCCLNRDQALIKCHTACARELFLVLPESPKMADLAAYYNRLHSLEELLSYEYPIDRRVVQWAALNGHVRVIKWALRKTTIRPTKRATQLAEGNGHLPCVQLLHEELA